MNVQIAPSILSADFARLAEAVQKIEQGGGDLVHVDVMDGHFVPNLTIGPPVVRALRKVTKLPLDCHLMIEQPQRYLDEFLDAGADMISVHVEAERHLHRALERIRSRGARAGVAINPATPAEAVTDALGYCDYVLAMTVNPGFGGQKFIRGVVEKIVRLRGMIVARGVAVRIEVDGGIDPTTARTVVEAGAEILVAGSAVFGQPDPPAAIRALRSAATSRLA
ncbi:MAG TPA: ribulose-phosphate 3-epimerase [Thermoanaerobaculia bacterium]|nr:ribulose-phosphate 3-epimerase [Thermoanaerobaculia bacterium]